MIRRDGFLFNFLGLLKSMSIPLIYMIVIGFLGGFVNSINIQLLLIVLFFPAYILIGILAPIWNMKTPFFSCFIGSLTLSVLNILSGQYFFDFGVMSDPEGLNRSLILSISISLITTCLYLSIRKKVLSNA